VVMNLAVNARDAMPRGGELSIDVAPAEVDAAAAAELPDARPGRYVVLSVADTGHGMDEATRAHLFEPFFTTKERGRGTGLGLSTVYGIVRQAGGHIAVETEVGRGTRFQVFWPRAAEGAGGAAAASAGGPEADAPGGSETVLLVEDDEAVRDLARTLLEEGGYRALVARDVEDAVRIAREHAGAIDLLLTDVVMPRMGGPELARAVAALRPGIRTIFMSAYTGDAVADRAPLEPGAAFLQKPFGAKALARKLREVLDAPRPAATSRAGS
ncbi:MAG TPA: ATP-binding protein, partial [Planctomycetota bacterium]|nr:ATP-binding protein [Planctomycetota bacterium]